jgi:acyl-homoserine lactone acylase PvdQ
MVVSLGLDSRSAGRARRIGAWLLGAALAIAGGASAQTAVPQPYGTNDYHGGGKVLNILPSGQKGVFSAAEEAQMALVCAPTADPTTCSRNEADYPAYTIDQLLMYDGLLLGAPTLTPQTLTDYYKDATFGVPAGHVLRQYSPGGRPGVVVVRDSDFDVPRIYATNRHDAIFATGYISAEDRLFFMDILRHVGRGRMSEFLGPSPANLAMDRDYYRAAGYDGGTVTGVNEFQQMVDNLDDQYGITGTLTQQGFADFAAGVNQYIQDALTNQNGAVLPAEYATLQAVPMNWSPADTVAVASLVTGIFGVGGGGELNNCNFLHELEAHYGNPATARSVFEDFQQDDDPEKPATTHDYFPYLVQGAVDPAAVACPDPGTLAQAIQGATMLAGDYVDGPNGPIRLFAKSRASNALVVGASRSATGHPLAVFGPQVGYFSPQILMEMEVHAPGVPGDPTAPAIDARGAAFPGISLLVLLGRGRDFSWSATSAGSDLVDVVAEKLCETNGSTPTTASRNYLYKGQCLPMYQRTDAWIAKPSAGGIPGTDPPAFPNPSQLPAPSPALLNDPLFVIGPAAPITGNILVSATALRTVHGIVQSFATVGGQPVAYVRQRSTFFHEPDGAPAFLKMNSPDLVQNASDFQHAMSELNSTFNWFYVDSKDIAYEVSGNYPIRAAGIDYDLPYFGTGQWDWQNWNPATWTADWLSFAAIPKDLNPAQGYLTSWNNAQAPGWNAADAELSYGPLHRVQPLTDRVAADASITQTELVQYMEDAGTVDLRGDKIVPVIAQLLGPSTGNANADLGLSVLTAWAAAGAHRRDLSPRDGAYDDAAAVALMDRWWVPLTDAVFDTLGPAVRNAMPLGRHDAPGPVGSSFIAGWYGIVHKDLRGAIAGAPVAPFSRVYCGNGVLAACRAAVRDSLAAAVAALGPNPATWDANEDGDRIQFSGAGTASVPDMDWVNRPTFQQAVEYRLDAQSPDTDGDGRNDDNDNCPFVANPGQEDTGGLATATPDGIGNACQCGDVTGNGIVNGQDANAIQRHGIGAQPNPLFLVPGNCDVTGNGQCNGQDANAVKRAALGQTSPTFGQRCHNATGEPVPPGL